MVTETQTESMNFLCSGTMAGNQRRPKFLFIGQSTGEERTAQGEPLRSLQKAPTKALTPLTTWGEGKFLIPSRSNSPTSSWSFTI